MTVHAHRVLLTMVTGSFLTASALATGVLAAPAIANAGECDTVEQSADAVPVSCEAPPCPDGSVRSGVSGDCVDQMTSLAEQLQQLPPPPGWSTEELAANVPALNASGLPPLAEVHMPDVVLPGLGLGVGVVPDIVLQPQFGVPSLPAPQLPNLTQIPPPQLPDLTKIPPPQLPDLTKIPPPQLPSFP